MHHRYPQRLHVGNGATDQRLRQALDASELVLADGMPIHWITSARARATRRVTGVDLMAELLRVAARERLRVYLLGARPEVFDELVRTVNEKHGGAVIAGRATAFSRPRGAQRSSRRSARAGPISSSSGCPLRSRRSGATTTWSARYSHRPAGGRRVRRARRIHPACARWMQACGLEWLWRMLMDPVTKWRRRADEPRFPGHGLERRRPSFVSSMAIAAAHRSPPLKQRSFLHLSRLLSDPSRCGRMR